MRPGSRRSSGHARARRREKNRATRRRQGGAPAVQTYGCETGCCRPGTAPGRTRRHARQTRRWNAPAGRPAQAEAPARPVPVSARHRTLRTGGPAVQQHTSPRQCARVAWVIPAPAVGAGLARRMAVPAACARSAGWLPRAATGSCPGGRRRPVPPRRPAAPSSCDRRVHTGRETASGCAARAGARVDCAALRAPPPAPERQAVAAFGATRCRKGPALPAPGWPRSGPASNRCGQLVT
jgi:hypothetical protein